MVSNVATAQFLNFDKIDEARYDLSALIDSNQVSNVVKYELLGSDESVEATNGLTCTTDSDKSLECDLRLILQEYSNKNGGIRSNGYLNYVMGGGLQFQLRSLCLGVKLQRFWKSKNNWP